MRRTVFGAFLLLAASAALAQTPASTDYYPIKKGSKWEYKVGETSIEVQVTAIDKDGAKLDTLVNNKTVASETIEVKADGVYRTKINAAAITPPVKVVELKDGKPVAKGGKWAIDSKIQDQPLKGSFSVIEDKEKVKVPAGEYEAVVVSGPEFEVAGTKTSVKYWFVAGQGIVKLSYSIAGNEAVLELKKYTPGQ